MVGKMIPYGALGFIELCAILAVMRIVFQVPIHGSTILLLFMALPYILTLLGLGLVISTKAKTQAEAFQLAMGTVLPSVFLSGYIFLIQNMPLFFQGISRIIPATYFIRILRGIILRGSTFAISGPTPPSSPSWAAPPSFLPPASSSPKEGEPRSMRPTRLYKYLSS